MLQYPDKLSASKIAEESSLWFYSSQGGPLMEYCEQSPSQQIRNSWVVQAVPPPFLPVSDVPGVSISCTVVHPVKRIQLHSWTHVPLQQF